MGIFSLFCCTRNVSHIHYDHSRGAAAESKSAAIQDAGKPEPYSEARARKLFKAYEDPDTPGEIGPEGFEKLCADLDISLEGALPLVLAWQMHATEMAKFKESEWMRGTGELRYVLFLQAGACTLRCDRGGNLRMDTHHLPMRSASNIQILSLVLRDIEDLLLLDKPPIQPSGTGSLKKRGNVVSTPNTSEPYNRQKYNQYAVDRTKGFTELYAFCFALAKPPYVTAPLGLFVSLLTLI